MGGKTIVGALIFGLISVELIKRYIGLRQSTGDLYAIPLALGIAIGRIGCFLTGLSDNTYGTPTNLPWAINFGDGIPRHPTQLYEIIFLIALIPLLYELVTLTYTTVIQSYTTVILSEAEAEQSETSAQSKDPENSSSGNTAARHSQDADIRVPHFSRPLREVGTSLTTNDQRQVFSPATLSNSS
jgi:hypothetical protein